MRKTSKVYHVHFPDTVSILSSASDSPRLFYVWGPDFVFPKSELVGDAASSVFRKTNLKMSMALRGALNAESPQKLKCWKNRKVVST